MDMVEWEIKTTSDKCSYREYIQGFDDTGFPGLIDQCDHPSNETKACIKSNCPEKVKKD